MFLSVLYALRDTASTKWRKCCNTLLDNIPRCITSPISIFPSILLLIFMISLVTASIYISSLSYIYPHTFCIQYPTLSLNDLLTDVTSTQLALDLVHFLTRNHSTHLESIPNISLLP